MSEKILFGNNVGYKMLPYGEGKSDRTAQTILLYTLFCIPASMLPWAMPNNDPMVGTLALVVAILCGLGFTWFAFQLKIHKTNEAASSLMFASFAYLPIVQIIYVLDKI